MSLVNLRPRKLGSFEEYTISLSRALTQRGGQSILVFKDAPLEALRPHYTDAGAILSSGSSPSSVRPRERRQSGRPRPEVSS